jgi:hypothetical protein
VIFPQRLNISKSNHILSQLVLERHSSREFLNETHEKVVSILRTRAITVDHLQKLFKGKNVTVACIFCSYQERSTQSLEELVASVLKQIVQDRSSASESIKAFCEKFHDQQKHPRLTNLVDALRSEIRTYSSVFIMLDALDECQEDYQGRLITELESLSSTVYLMVTSRPLDLIKQRFRGACHLDINAMDGDVRKYIESRIRQGQTKNEILLAQLVQENHGLRDSIAEKIVTNARGMFVLLISVSDLHLLYSYTTGS